MTAVRSFVALGGNVGDVAAMFDRAIAELAIVDGIEVGAISSNHRFPAVGENAGDDFLNAACELLTTLSAEHLLKELQRVELQCGRTRDLHWGPRTLDLDLILYGDEMFESPELTVPHPACWYRRFVLDPLTEIAGDVVDPVKGITIAALRDRLLARPLPVALSGGTQSLREELRHRIESQFEDVRCDSDWKLTGFEPALLFWLGAPLAHGTAETPDERTKTGASVSQCAPGTRSSEFPSLPLLPRIDVSAASDPFGFIRDVLTAALGV